MARRNYEAYCHACSLTKPLEESFRVFRETAPTRFFDFCKACEAKHGFEELYKRYARVAMPEIAEFFEKGGAKQLARVEKKQATLQEEARKDVLRREMARRHIIPFVMRFMPQYKAGWVHHDICRRLERFVEAVEHGESPRLILAMPPRAGKSELASNFFPSWVLGKHPDWEIISTSYAVTLPVEFSRKIRDRLRDPAYHAVFEKTRLRDDASGVEQWRLTEGGGYRAAGVGGGITGMGANIAIVDDPFKDDEEAQSETIREKVKNWFTSTLMTRLAPNNGVLIIACMAGDTQVSMADGTYKHLEVVRPGDKVLAYKNGEMVAREVLNWAPQGEDDVFEIKTGSSTVRANARHPFLVERRNGSREWVRTDALRPGDKLVNSATTKFEQSATVTEQEAWLLGFMFGDGWLTYRDSTNYDRARDKYYPRRGIVTCAAFGIDAALNAKVEATFKALFGIELKKGRFGYWRTEKQTVGQWFKAAGLAGTAHTKRVPEYMYRQPANVRQAFLDGFTDADGHTVVNGPNRGRIAVKLCNEPLTRDIRHLARSIGWRVGNVFTRTQISEAPSSPRPMLSTSSQVSWSPARRNEEAFVAYSAVRSITPVGREMVYDIQVDDAECFIADGLVTHNTRWHDDDLSGACLAMAEELRAQEVPEDEIDAWELVSYPALAESEEYLFPDGTIQRDPLAVPEGARLLREKGDALHPERYDAAALRRKRNTMPSRQWNAMYQQNPVPDDGDFFSKDMFRYEMGLTGVLDEYTFITAWDVAIGEKRRNDWTVGVVGAIDAQNHLHVVDMVRGRMGTTEIVTAVCDFIEKYDCSVLGMEHGQIKMTLWPLILEEMRRRKLTCSINDALKPVNDKETRATPLRGMMQTGRVWFPYPGAAAPWMEKTVQEMLRFPAGAHDDIVDALSWLAWMFRTAPRPRQLVYESGTKELSWRDRLEEFGVSVSGSTTFMSN